VRIIEWKSRCLLRLCNPHHLGPLLHGARIKTQLTEIGRALSQLGITHIPSYSPQGRGQRRLLLSFDNFETQHLHPVAFQNLDEHAPLPESIGGSSRFDGFRR
jgi:hypothetical protein